MAGESGEWRAAPLQWLLMGNQGRKYYYWSHNHWNTEKFFKVKELIVEKKAQTLLQNTMYYSWVVSGFGPMKDSNASELTQWREGHFTGIGGLELQGQGKAGMSEETEGGQDAVTAQTAAVRWGTQRRPTDWWNRHVTQSKPSQHKTFWTEALTCLHLDLSSLVFVFLVKAELVWATWCHVLWF